MPANKITMPMESFGVVMTTLRGIKSATKGNTCGHDDICKHPACAATKDAYFMADKALKELAKVEAN